MTWRTRLKRTLEATLVRTGASRLTQAVTRSDVLVLAYHNIVPSGERQVGDVSLHLPQSTFADQLELIGERCDLVSLDAALKSPEPASRPRVAITFDDAYTGALTAGSDELRRRDLPYTMFVAPASLEGSSFWWDALVARGEPRLPETLREHFLWKCKGHDSLVRDHAGRFGRTFHELPEHARCATEHLLTSVAADTRMSMASHSWSHSNLAALDPANLKIELERSREWVRARNSVSLDCVAYPYGFCSDSVASAAATAGYEAGFLVEGGWIRNASALPWQLPRLNVPASLSLDGFRLRLDGLLCR
jgi:peptidoglycan/xylan/chitin deacetylase (PgdA/CDA1 family)